MTKIYDIEIYNKNDFISKKIKFNNDLRNNLRNE